MPLSPLVAMHVDLSVCGANASADPPASPNPICSAVLEFTDGRAPVIAQLLGTTIPTILKIVLVVIVAWVANRLIRRAIRRLVQAMTQKGVQRLGAIRQVGPLAGTSPINLQRATMRTETIGGVLRSIATVVIWSVALVTILGAFNINLGPLIAGAGIAGVAIGFGAQSLVRDFLSGIFMLLEDQYGIGDVIDTGVATGVVEGISLRTTRLRDVEGTVWHVPNGEIRRIGNKSQQWARSLLDVGVAYDTDIDVAKETLKRVADEMWRDERWGQYILEEPEVWGVERFDADQITIRMVIKVTPADQWMVNRELRGRIKRAFDEAGIVIPFPQRTVWLRGAPEDAPANDGSAARQEAPVNAPETSE